MKLIKFLDESMANGFIVLGFTFTTLMVAGGLWQAVYPPQRVVGLGGTELLILFGPAWFFWTGWLIWVFSEKRAFSSIYPRKAKFAVVAYYCLFVGAAAVAAISNSLLRA